MLVRHGESQWNKENRFTGWVDVPLAEVWIVFLGEDFGRQLVAVRFQQGQFGF